MNKPVEDTLLVVDDMPDNVAVLFNFLTTAGFSVIVSHDGQDALETVSFAHPDLILLDIMMPGMSGFEVCQRLKAKPETQDIPIIFITALTDIDSKIKGFSLGAADYITKPIQHEEVLARVTTQLKVRRLQKQLLEQKQAVEAQNYQLRQEISVRKQVENSLQRTATLLAERTIQLQEQRETLQKHTTELEKRNAELDSFARTVAHDLKNPLTGVIGITESLLLNRAVGDPITPKFLERLQFIVYAGHKMLNIIEALLLLAGVTRQTTVEIRPIDMTRVVTQVIEHRIVDLLKNLNAEVVLPTQFPVIQGFAPWLEEVWANYLSNALKYGGRPPRLELGGEFIADNKAKFWVIDNGEGITAEKQAKLFTPFTRLHQDYAEGHGLGLSIVRQIIEKLGGEVGVESRIGEGSCFYFILPVKSE